MWQYYVSGSTRYVLVENIDTIPDPHNIFLILEPEILS